MFTKGIAKFGGRKKGTPNKLTGTFREAVCLAYESIGGHEAFAKWAAENRTDFYRIAARLIPTENKDHDREGITVIIQGPREAIDKTKNPEIMASADRNQIVDEMKSASTNWVKPHFTHKCIEQNKL